MNIALIGCGRIAKKHAEILSKGYVSSARLAAVCDKNIQKAKQIGESFDVPYYTDMDELMMHENIDIVSVLTESGNHSKHTINLAKYGKHIIVEKPMALTLNDADEMIRACSENNCKLFVIKQNRFNKPVVQLKKAIDNGRFGKLVMGTVRVRWCRTQEYYDQDPWRGTWALDGGVLSNQASHHIDLLQWIMGEVESVYAKSITALVDIEAEDTAVAVLKFKNGALGIIEATTAVRPDDLEGSISILGEKGTVEISGFAVNQIKHWKFCDEQEIDKSIISESYTTPPNVYGFGHIAYYDDVIKSIQQNKKSLIEGFDGRKSLELILALYESIETGKEVFLRYTHKKCKLGILD